MNSSPATHARVAGLLGEAQTLERFRRGARLASRFQASQLGHHLWDRQTRGS